LFLYLWPSWCKSYYNTVFQLITVNSSVQQPSSCHNSLFKDTSIDTIILSVCKCLCSEYLLVTKPGSFSFINSQALLKTHAACSRFFASKSESCWTSRRRNILNFKSSFAIRLTVLLEIQVSRWMSRGDLLVPGSSSWLQINWHPSNVSGASCRVYSFKWLTIWSSCYINFFIRRFNVLLFNPLLGKSLIIWNELNPLLCRKIRIKTRSSSVNGAVIIASLMSRNDNKIGQPGLFQTFQ